MKELASQIGTGTDEVVEIHEYGTQRKPVN